MWGWMGWGVDVEGGLMGWVIGAVLLVCVCACVCACVRACVRVFALHVHIGSVCAYSLFVLSFLLLCVYTVLQSLNTLKLVCTLSYPGIPKPPTINISHDTQSHVPSATPPSESEEGAGWERELGSQMEGLMVGAVPTFVRLIEPDFDE